MQNLGRIRRSVNANAILHWMPPPDDPRRRALADSATYVAETWRVEQHLAVWNLHRDQLIDGERLQRSCYWLRVRREWQRPLRRQREGPLILAICLREIQFHSLCALLLAWALLLKRFGLLSEHLVSQLCLFSRIGLT